MTLRQTVVRSLSWNILARGGTQIFQLGLSVALARLLTPKEYGVIGMLIVFTGFAQILSDSGLTSALIYHQNITERHRSTAFWLQSAIGTALMVLFFLGAPLIADFYALPILSPMTRMVSVVFFLRAIGQTQCALLTKEFQFRRLAVANIGATVVSGAIAVTLAIKGYGVWALAWQLVIPAFVTTLLYWIQTDWRPRFVFGRDEAIELGRYAIYLLGHTSLNYWTRNGDNLAIGKVLGAADLGIYARAYSLMLLPMNNISAVVGQVMFPALSRLQEDLPRFVRVYLKATCLIAFVTFPAMTGLAILAGPIVQVLFGSKWTEVAPLLQIFSLVGALQSIVFPVAWAFTALGRTKTQFHNGLALMVIFVVGILIGIQFGIMGVTRAYAGIALVSAVINLYVVGRIMKTSMLTILGSLAKITTMAALMGIAVWLLDANIAYSWHNWERVTAGTICGISVYLALCVFARDETFAEFLRLAGMKR